MTENQWTIYQITELVRKELILIFENVLFRENGFYNALVSRMKDIVGRFQ